MLPGPDDRRRSPYSNIEVMILANRPAFTRESLSDRTLFGLLPVANKPLLTHLLQQFDSAGLLNITLVCLKKDVGAYREFLEQSWSHPVSVVPIDGDVTTGQIIRKNAKVGSHILLYPIDLMTSVDITSIIDFHLMNRARITMLTETVAKAKQEPVPGYQLPARQSNALRVFVVDDSDPKRLIALLSNPDALFEDLDISLKQAASQSQGLEPQFEQGMDISPEFLQGYNSYTADTELKLAGVYLLSPKCVAFCAENTDVHSVESELIPRMCAEKRALIFRVAPDKFTMTISNFGQLFLANLKCAGGRFGKFTPSAEYKEISESGVGYYSKGKHQVDPSFKFERDCVFGDNVKAQGEQIIVRRSVVGEHVKIGAHSNIQNTVLFDHVTIMDHVTLQNCIVMQNAIIRPETNLKQCIVAPMYTKEGALTAKCEIIDDQ